MSVVKNVTVNAIVGAAELREVLAALPTAVRTGPDAKAIMTRAGLAALGRIRAAFIVKSHGGTDEAGDRWAPLSPATIAYRASRTKTEKKRESRPSQALSKKQQERWWNLYRQGLAIYKGSKAAAAKRAWAILKSEGAVTLFDKYSGGKADILRDTGLLLSSLSPGTSKSEQVFRTGAGEVTVGTNRKGAAAHHHGVPGRLPQRRLWPEPKKWPATWWQDIADQIVQGVIDAVIQAAGRKP